jgi:hypothetical protein
VHNLNLEQLSGYMEILIMSLTEREEFSLLTTLEALAKPFYTGA